MWAGLPPATHHAALSPSTPCSSLASSFSFLKEPLFPGQAHLLDALLVQEAGRESGHVAIVQRQVWMVRHRHDVIPLGFPLGLPLPSPNSADSRGLEHLEAVPSSSQKERAPPTEAW